MTKIDIITGFLGAGKTSFMRKALQSSLFDNEKVVIIENEFGEVNIDGALLKNEEVPVYEISKGCICCTLKQDFLTTLEYICNNLEADRILIEPSGIFVLQDLQQVIQDSKLKGKCELGRIITIVDAPFFLQPKSSGLMFVRNQIAGATHLVVSKLEHIDASQEETLINKVREINKEAPLLVKKWDDMDKDSLSQCFFQCETELAFKEDYYFEHTTDQPIASFLLKGNKSFTEGELKDFMSSVSEGTYGEILRLKGHILCEEGSFFVNYVNERFNYYVDTEESCTQLNVIGLELQRDELEKVMSV